MYKYLVLKYKSFCVLLFALAAILEPVNESFALCVGSSLETTCSSSNASVLKWMVTTNSGSSNCTALKKFLSNSNSLQDGMICDFVVRLESKNPLVSTVTLDEVDPKHNGTVLTCMTYTSQGSEEFTQTTILIVKGNWSIKQHATTICKLNIQSMPFFNIGIFVFQILPQLHCIPSFSLSHSLQQSSLGLHPLTSCVSVATS